MCFSFKWILLIFLMNICWIEIDCSIQFFGSKTVNYGDNYEVYIVNTYSESDKVMKLQLDGKLSGVIEKKLIDFNDLRDRKVSFDLQNHKFVENFTLSATIAELNYSQIFHIEMIHDKFSVFIQTDNFSYKPGDKIRFRVFVADNKWQPYHSDKLFFEVRDGNGEVIYKVDELEIQEFKGIYDQEVLVSDSSQVGTWTVEVKEVDDDERIEVLGFKSFLVSDEPANRFKVTMNSRHATLVSEQFLEVEVFAVYGFGFFVKGKVSVQATVIENGEERKSEMKTMEISEKILVKFKISEDLKLNSLKGKALVRFDCEFTETATGKKISKSHQTLICRTLCNDIEIVIIGEKVKPGFPFAFQVNVYSMETRELIQTSLEPLNVEIFFSDSESRAIKDANVELEGFLNNGTANFSFVTPRESSSISINASFMNSTNAIEVKTSTKKASEYLNVELITKKPMLGEEVELKIYSTVDLDVLNCVIFQSSNIVHETTIDCLFYNEVTFAFEATFAMHPSINIIIYFISDEGELISDELFIELSDEFEELYPSKLLLDVSPSTLDPGSNCSITITSTSNAIVSLAVVNDEDFKNQNFRKTVASSYFMSNQTVPRSTLESDRKLESYVRDSSEPWLFDILKPDSKGILVVNKTVPNATATWSIAAVSFEPAFGFKFSNIHTFTVDYKFSFKVDWPISIRFGEIISVNVIVFNKLPSMELTVSLKGSEESEDFEFIEKTVGCGFSSLDEKPEKLSVKSNSTGIVTFLIRPLKFGNIVVRVTARENERILFEEEKILKVELENLAKFIKSVHTIDLRRKNELTQHFTFRVPKGAVRGSIEVEGRVMGDLLGQALKDSSDLMFKPTVQTNKANLLLHMQLMLSIKYLTESSQTSPVKRTSMINQLSTAMQQLMSRINPDGSFSFRGQGGFESIWLTAYAVKCLSQVRNLTSVNETSIENALNFLKSHQQSSNSVDVNNRSLSGSFIELGGEKKMNLSLTAFVAISFLECSKSISEHDDSVNKALEFINRNGLLMNNNLEIAMSAYAFALAKHTFSADLLSHLKAKAIIEQGKHHWCYGLETDEKKSALDQLIELEIAAYAVLACIESKQESDVYPIMMWMIEQINDGNVMIKDSIVTSQALAELARIYLSSAMSMSLTVSDKSIRKQVKVNIDESNAAKSIYFDLPNDIRDTKIHAKGTGFALLEVSLKYNELAQKFKETFSISVDVKPRDNHGDLTISICAIKKFEGETSDQILVDVVMQVELPQGFIYDPDSREILNILNVKKIEIHNHQSLVTLYFDFQESVKICPEIKARFVATVEQSSMSTVKIQYRKETVAIEYYSIKGSQYCGNSSFSRP